MNRFRPFAELYPGVEFRDIRGHHFPGYLTKSQVAKALGTTHTTLVRFLIGDRLFTPDFYNTKSIFFREDRLEELKAKWDGRLGAFPDSAPVKGVITSFGLMLPRVKPKREVLERLMQERPKRRSRDSSWRTRKHYNLSDLMS